MSLDTLYTPIVFRTAVQLPPKDLAAAGDSLDEVLRERLEGKLQGVCSRFGYILPGSIQVVRRSVGTFLKQHFNGYIVFQLLCQAKACNPTIGSVVSARVSNTNDLGIHADSQGVLDIIVPRRSAGITSEIDLDALRPGDPIYVEVLGKRFTLNDKKISVIGRCLRDKKKEEASVTAAAPLVEGADEEEVEENNDEEEEETISLPGGDEEEEPAEAEDDDAEGGDYEAPEADQEPDEAVVLLGKGEPDEEESEEEEDDLALDPEDLDDEVGGDGPYGGSDDDVPI